MTAKFDAFKAALEALCKEHGVVLMAMGYEAEDIGVWDVDAGYAADHLDDCTLGTPEEQAAARVEAERQQAERLAAEEAAHAEFHRRVLAAGGTPRIAPEVAGDATYQALMQMAREDAEEQRKKEMRVSTDPQDAAYDPRPRRVWRNDVEVTGWTVADEFRRMVIVDGKPLFGSIRIERLESGEGGNPLQATPTTPIDTGFVGVMVHTPETKPEVVTTPAPEVESMPVAPVTLRGEAAKQFQAAMDAQFAESRSKKSRR